MKKPKILTPPKASNDYPSNIKPVLFTRSISSDPEAIISATWKDTKKNLNRAADSRDGPATLVKGVPIHIRRSLFCFGYILRPETFDF